MPAPASETSSRGGTGRRVAYVAIGLLLAGGLAMATGWGALAIYYSDLTSATLRTVLALLFSALGIVTLVLLARRQWRWHALGGFALAFAVLLAWWSSIAPSNDRDWKPEVAVLPYATEDGNRVTVHNIRNFAYRSETDFTPAYYDKTFDLDKLESVDIIASYWAGPAIAHVFLSFGFGPDGHLAISIERRDEKGEDYSTVKGLFKQYELFYVVADERDLIRLRTNYRRDPPEDVYVYRLKAPRENGQRVFREYLQEINSLRERPQFYNTLAANCTGNLWLHTRVNPGHVPYSWKVLVSGYVPEYLYEQGRLDTRLSFDELRRRGHVNDLARAADQAPDFSRRIRARLVEPVLPVSK
jgi:hypothetical protein